MNFIETFFFWCSGANIQILQSPECRSDRSKYFGVGTAVFFTGLFAALAAGFALTFVVRSGDAPLTQEQIIICATVGILWGLLIFSLDRFIVSSIKKTSSFFWQLLQALPRIFLAVIIGLVISMPLELKIFEKEINLSLVKMANQELIDNKMAQESSYQGDFNRNEQRVAELKESIALKNTEKADIEAAISRLPYKTCTDKNADGTTSTYSCRPGITALRAKLAAKNEEIGAVQAKIEARFETVDTISQKIDTSNTTLEGVLQQGYGLDKRIEALFGLDTVAHWFVMLLFIFVEITPVLTKLLLPRGSYDMILDAEEKEVSSDAFFRVYQKNSDIHKKITGKPDPHFLSEAADAHTEGTKRMLEDLEDDQGKVVTQTLPPYIKKTR